MTRKLYLDDPYRLSFDGHIVQREETSDGSAVILEETYFYPESGGQPYDLGTIDGIPIRRIEERGEEVIHVLDRMPEKDRVSCIVDGARRHEHMQQHSGQHILSAAFIREANVQTLSFHLGSSTSTIDLDTTSLGLEALSAAEREANRAVCEAAPIRSYFVKPAEASRLKLRKAPEVEGILRIVEVEGFDLQACCGTHPRNTSEVGPILIRGAERLKKGTRLEFVCGDRALKDYRASVDKLHALSQLLAASEDNLVEAAEKLSDEKNRLRKTLQSLREELIELKALRMAADAPVGDGATIFLRRVDDVTPAELRLLANCLTKETGRVACLGCVADERAHLVFGRSRELTIDMAALLRECLGAVDGKGGGSPQMAQGGGPRVAGLDDALAIARRSLAKL
jgi:alanyl-tRNA synthetase